MSSWSLEGFHLAFQEAKISTWKEGFLDGLSLGSRHLTYEKENIYPHARRWYQKQGVTSEEDKLGHLHKTQCGGLQLPASQPPPPPHLNLQQLGAGETGLSVEKALIDCEIPDVPGEQ